MRRFLLKLLAFKTICLLVGFGLHKIVDTGLRKSSFTDENKEWDDITAARINADIIIQGSSKAWRQFSPKAFEDAFDLSTHNLGLEGHTFPMQKWRSDLYLKYNKKPRYIIQQVALTEMANPVIAYNYIQFIPYLNEGFMDRFGGHSYLDYRDAYIPLYKYSRKTGLMERGLANLFSKNDNRNLKYKGFLAADWHWSDTAFVKVQKQHPNGLKADVSAVAHAHFVEMINYCRDNNIKLILVCPPTHVSFQNHVINRHEVIGHYRNYSTKHGLKFIDYSNDAMCRDTSVFYDFNHLNVKGVAQFNAKLIADLKNEIR